MVTVDDRQRSFILYNFQSDTSQQPRPLLIVLHGGGGTSRRMERYGKYLNERAEAGEAVLIYPEAHKKHWNAAGTPISRNRQVQVDDAAFLSALIDLAILECGADPQQVYITGISRGGMMSLVAAWKLGHRIRAIAPVIASLHFSVYEEFELSTPVSCLLVNGTADPLIPYEGGTGRLGRKRLDYLPVAPTEELIAHIARMNGCQQEPTVEELPDKNEKDNSHALRLSYPSCSPGIHTELIKVIGGGHTLPGGRQYLPKSLVGPLNHDFDVWEMVWRFFEREK